MTAKPHRWSKWALMAVAAITIVSGLAQMLAPGLILTLLSAETTPASKHFFGIVGMFMALFGGALLHALLSSGSQSVVILWAALQKCGAVCAVTLGVANHIFSPLALAVAGFDLLSAILALWYWRDALAASARPGALRYSHETLVEP